MVRSPGGSPAWALLEAAKGSFAYISLWSDREAESCDAENYDLDAGILLVRGAGGGAVTDLMGVEIGSLSYRRPFVPGLDGEARRHVQEIVRSQQEREA